MENSVSSLITGSISISKEDKDTLLSSLDSLSARELEVIKQTLILEPKNGDRQNLTGVRAIPFAVSNLSPTPK